MVYVDESNFEKEVKKSNQTVLVDFFANWCGPCKMLSPIIEQLSDEIKDVKFVKIDIDLAPALAREYEIMSIPTLIVIKDGKEQKRSVGLIDKFEILELLK